MAFCHLEGPFRTSFFGYTIDYVSMVELLKKKDVLFTCSPNPDENKTEMAGPIATAVM